MTKKQGTTVAVVDDHPLMRNGIMNMLSTLGHSTTIEADHGGEFIAAWNSGVRCKVAIVDLCMPVMDGWATIAYITEHHPEVLAIAITFDANAGAVRRALQHGARAVLCKTALPPEWAQALHDVLGGGFHRNSVLDMVVQHAPMPGSAEALRAKVLKELTPCQLEFLMAYTADDEPTLTELATRKNLARCTMESHREAVVEKTGAHSRLAMYRFTQQFGLR